MMKNTFASSNSRFESTLALTQSHINQVISAYMDSLKSHSEYQSNSELIDAMSYGILLGGKRIRPYLVYQVAELVGLSNSAADVIATALESIHAYSLIHDDLPAMDNDILRRGNPTCHVKYGEANAILAADALQTFSFEILSEPLEQVSPSKQLKIINLLAKSSGANGMCGGQALDLKNENHSISFEALKEIHSLKTGALIYAAVMMPLIASSVDSDIIFLALEKYAKTIGLAFQIQDDILDVEGDTDVLGKMAGADEALGKNTYPSLLGLNEAKIMATELIDEAKKQIEQLSYLPIFKDNPALLHLQDLADFIITRSH